MIKKAVWVLTVASLFIFAASVGAECAEEIQIYAEGKNADAGAILMEGTTMVPIRKISEALGFDVLWNGEEKSVTVSKEGSECKIYIGKTEAQKGQTSVTLLKAPEIIEDTTYVPVRFVSESLDYGVFWNEYTKSVYIAKCMKADRAEMFGTYCDYTESADGSVYYFYDSGKTGYIAIKDGYITEIFSADEKFAEGEKNTRTTVLDEIYCFNAFGADSKPYRGGAGKEEILSLQEKMVFYAVNAVRRANGFENLELNERISNVDRRHVASMAKEGYFSHTGSDGLTFRQRYENTYGAPEYSLAGENLAKASNAGGAVYMWLKSESHRNAVMTEKFKLTGICAYSSGENELIYFAQVFVKPKE